ncbi:MAG TPA: CARDB domain-containing protein, partial [Rhodocyclaceae bacterium]|nr:CARDB domain-containing protein [Rhodocyclaceae bacterium]
MAFEPLEPRVLLDGTPSVPITRIDGSIDVAGETDRYGFTLSNDARIVFDSLTNSNSFTWSLSGPRGDVVSSRAFAQSDADNAQPVLQLAAGDYTLSVDGVMDTTGNYAFRLIDLNAARAIDAEVPVTATLETGYQTDAFAFDAAAGDRFVFDNTGDTINATWRLIDPFGAQIGSNHGFGDFDSGSLAATGRYTLLVEGRIGAAADATPYAFRVLKAGEKVSTLTPGDVTRGTLASAAQSARYDFTLGETGQYFFDSLTADSRLTWSLRGPLGQTVSPRSFYYSDAYYSTGALALGPGDYSLYVSASSDFSGDYAFRLANLTQATPVNFDVDTAATLDPANGSLMYSFSGTAGERIALQQTGSGPSQTVFWRILGADGQQIAGVNYFGGFMELPKLADSGTYTLIFEGDVTASGTTDFSFRMIQCPDVTEAIALGDVIDRSIDTPGQVDHFTFSLASATRAVFDSLSNDYNLSWGLYTADGRLVAQRGFAYSDGWSSGDGLLDLAAGDYQLVVDPYADFTGPFSFRLLDTSAGSAISLGDTVTVDVGHSGRDTTVYNFDGQSGDQVEFNFTYLSGEGGAVYSLFDPYGRRVLGATDGSPQQSRLELTGRYTLLVEGNVFSNNDSSYELFLNYLSNDGGNTLPVGTAINVGDEVTGAVDDLATPVVYNFTLNSETILLFDALGEDEYALNWSLTGPRGEEVSHRAFYTSDGGYYYYGLPPGQLIAGDYALTLYGPANQAFDFRLVDARSTAAPLAFGTETSGTLQPGNAVQVYSIDATAGDVANLVVNSSWNGGLFVYDPDGNLVVGPTYAGSQSGISFSRTGTYLLVLSGPRWQTWDTYYDFRLNLQSSVINDIQLGDGVTGTADSSGAHQRYRFTVTEPQRVLFDSRTGNSGLYWNMSGPQGVERSDTNFYYADGYLYGNSPVLTLNPGTHFIDVWSTSGASADFAFSVLPVSAAKPIDVNQMVSGTLDPANGIAAYSFDGQAGDQLNLSALSSSQPYYNMAWRLIGPSGQQVASYYFYNFTPSALPESGKYLLLVEGNNSLSGQLDFSFQVNRPVVVPPVGITLDTTINGNHGTTAQNDRYSFHLDQSTRVYFDYLSGSTNLNWSLAGPRGTIISQRGLYSDTADYSGPASIDLAAGDYIVTISGGATGAYAFRLVNEENKPVIAYGDVVKSQLSPGSEMEMFSFDAQAGDQVFVDTKPGTSQYSSYIRLIDPFGRQVASGYYFSDIDTVKLAYTGRYSVIVEGLYYYSGNATDYAFSVEKVSSTSQAIDVNGTTGLDPVYVAAPDGDALVLGPYGSAQRANDPALNLTGSLTLEARVKVNSFANGWMPLIVKDDGDSNHRTYSMWINSGGYVLLTSSDQYYDQSVSTNSGTIKLGEWVDIAGVIDRTSGQLRIYLNGQLAVSGSLRTNAAFSHGGPLLIGATNENWNGWANFDGAIDTVRIWNGVRTQTQIDTDRSTAPAPDAAGLVADYRFAASGGSTLVDSSAHGLNGAVVNTLTGMPGTIVGRIDRAGGSAAYTFTLTGPRTFYVDTLLPSRSDFRWSLSGPSGLLVNRAAFTDTEQIVTLDAGDYSLVVDGDGDVTGGFALRLMDLSATTAITYDQVVSGTLTPSSGATAYTFNAVAGDRAYFDALSNSTGNIRWRLLDPYGNTAFSYRGLSDVDTLTLGFTGAYTLLVEGYNGDMTTASYSFNVRRVVDSVTPLVIGQSSGLDPRWVPGKSGNAVQLDGYDWVEAPATDALNLTGSSTTEFWFKADAYSGTWTPLVFKGNGDSNQRQVTVWLNNAGYLHLSTNTNGTWQGVSTNVGSVQLGQWEHVAAVIDRIGNRLKVYINGTLAVDGGLAGGSALSNSKPLMFGSALESYPRFTGSLDDVRIWNTVRGASDIATDMSTALSGNEAGLVAYYRLDESAGRSVADASSQNSPATVRHILQSLSGTAVEGAITTPGQQVRYTFSLASAKRLAMDSFTTNSNIYWTLTGPRGTVISNRTLSYSDAAEIGGTSPSMDLGAGDYVLTIDGYADTTGPFAFRLMDLNAGSNLAYDTPVSGTLDPGSSNTVYHFTGTSGDRLFFNATSLTNVGQTPYVRLLDPRGQQVWSNYFSNIDVFSLAATGDYTLVIEGSAYQTVPIGYGFTLYRVTDDKTSLTLDSTVNGTLAIPGQTDQFSFHLAQDTRVYFDSLTANSSLTWTLAGASGSVVSRNFYYSDSDGLGGTNPFMLLRAGDYTLTVDGSGNTTGAYAFRLLTAASAEAITVGTEVNTSFDPYASHLYSFDAAAGDQVMLDFLDRTSSFYPIWRLFDTDGQQLFYNYLYNDSGTLTLPKAGHYLIAIEPRIYDGSGTARFQVTSQGHVDLPAPPVGDPITLGAQVNGNLTSGTDSKTYALDLSDARRLYFDVLSNTPYVQWSLTGPSGALVTSRYFYSSDGSNASSYGNTPILDLAAGHYTLTVGGSAGAFAFRLLDLAAATAVTLDSSGKADVSGQLSPRSETDAYSFTATAGERYYFQRLQGNYNSAIWRLIGPSGQVVMGPSDQWYDVENVTLPEAGTYTLLIEGPYYYTDTANYSFRISRITDPAPVTIDLGQVVSGSIDSAGQVSHYTLVLDQARQVYFDTLGSANDGAVAWTLSNSLLGSVVNSRAFSQSNAYDRSGNGVLLDLAAGTYDLVVDGAGSFTGAYKFRLLDTTAAATTITLDSTVVANVDPADSTRFYRFDATAGQRVFFDMLGSTGSTPYWRVIGPHGEVVQDVQWGGSDRDVTTLPSSGSYLLMVEGVRNATGTASLSFNLRTVTDKTDTLTLGSTVNASIDAPGQTSRYTFTLGDRKRVFFDALNYNGNVTWSLTGPRGVVVSSRAFGSSDGTTNQPWLDLPAGDYQLVFDAPGDSTGAFQFRLLDAAQATAITPGTVVTGVLSPVAEMSLYTLALQAGDRIYLDSLGVDRNAYDLSWRLLDPYGRIVASPGGFVDVDVTTAAFSGNYMLIVEGQPAAVGTANYSFNISPAPLSKVVPIAIGDQPGADLVVSNLAVTPVSSDVHSGGQVVLSWDTVNAGTLPTSGSWKDQIVVRNSRGELIYTQLVDHDEAVDGPLASGAKQSHSLTLTLPDGNRGAGTLSFRVTTDVENTVAELGSGGAAELNNAATVSVASTLSPYADLQVANLNVSPAAGWAPGSQVTLSWRDVNAGVGATSGGWTDSIVVRNLSTGRTFYVGSLAYDATANGDLGAGDGRDRQLTLVWPADAQGIGRFEFSVVADAQGQIFENNANDSAESNNTAALTVTSAPDLVVGNLRTTPSSTESGSSVTVQWDTVNQGLAGTLGSWVERVTVVNPATGETLVDTRLTYDPSVANAGNIAAGANRNRSYTFTLPEGQRAVGALNVTVSLDYNGQLVESDETNNSANVVLNVAKKKYADLAPVSLEAPPSARGGDTVTLRWTVTNQGDAPTGTQWTDRIVLSADGIYGNADDVVLVTAPHFGSLAPGESYTQERQVVLPQRVDGAYKLFLRTDVNAEVLEPDTRANNLFGPKAINIAAPHADLVVEAVSAPTAAQSGDSVKVSWRVRNTGDSTTDSSQWKDYVYLSSDNQLDASDILLAQVDHTGQFLAVGDSYTASANVFLTYGLTGNYSFIVRTDAENRVFEANFETNNTTAALQTTKVTPAPVPDLQVSAITLPAQIVSGQTAHVAWTVNNGGGGTAKGPWTDRVYLSTDGTLNSPTFLGDVAHTGNLDAGGSLSSSLDFIVPALADGNYRIVIVTDVNGQIYEGGSGSAGENNQFAATVPVALVHPDLVPLQLDAPSTAVSGNRVTLTYTIRNDGTGAAGGDWIDRIYLSRDTTVDASDTLLATRAVSGPLAAGQGYGGSVDFDLPLGAQGTYYLLVAADANNQLPERNAEGNNVASRQLDVTLDQYAQLVTTDVQAPTLTIGDPAQITVSWTVANQGTGVGRTATWTDALIASTDSIVGNSDDKVVGEFVHTGGLAVGDSYSRTETFLLPAYFQGRYHFFVKTDAKNAVFENGNEADNAKESPQIFDVMSIPYADLVVSAASAPTTASSGQTMSVTWTVANTGIGPTDIPGWNDEVVLTSDAAGNNVVANLGSFTHLGVLAAGDSYTRTQDVSIPNGLSGSYYVRVRSFGPFEFVYTQNNTRVAGPVQIALSPSPDLQVTDIQTPSTANEGDYIDVKWTVTNNGAAKADGSWTDMVYMRKVGQPNDPGIYLGTFSFDAGGLDAGKSYTRTERFKLPARTEGVYQAVVVTNANANSGGVYEYGTAAANNTTADDQILQVALLPRPDLQVGTVVAPSSASAGAAVSLRFSIINQGTVPTATPHWKDNVYLSLDNKLTGDDLLIGSYDNGAALNPGEQYATETGSLQIPIRFRGDVFLIVQADGSGSVDEYPNDANNITAVPLYVNPYPLADLVTGGVVAPAQAVEGANIEVRYTVANKGSGTTASNSGAASWTDTIWLSRDKTRPNAGGNSAVMIGTVQHNGALKVGESYDVVTNVNLPSHLTSGTYYVTVWSDSYDVILEDTLASNLNPDDPHELDNNNYKARAIDIIGGFEPPPPDLKITALTASPQASTSSDLTVNWTVTNAGAGEASGKWYDVFWLSDKPDLNASGAKQWYLGSILHDG